jgi:uncharacterized protein YndB with AHSA1/START domain
MRSLFLAAILATSAAPALAETNASPDVANTSSVTPAGDRVLRLSIDLDAPPAAIWAAFTDPATIRRWSAPLAIIDLRTGGSMEESYDPAGKAGGPDNIRHELLLVSPNRLLVFRNTNAPHQLTGREAYKQVVSALEIDDLGAGRSRLVLTQTGYGQGAEFDSLYAFFSRENAWLMEELKTQLETPAGKLHGLLTTAGAAAQVAR